MPTVFKILCDVHADKSNPYEQSVQQGIKLIAFSLALHQQLIDSGLSDHHNPINFNSLAQSIKQQPDLVNTIQSMDDLVIRRSDYHIRPKADPAVERHPQGYIGL